LAAECTNWREVIALPPWRRFAKTYEREARVSREEVALRELLLPRELAGMKRLDLVGSRAGAGVALCSLTFESSRTSGVFGIADGLAGEIINRYKRAVSGAIERRGLKVQSANLHTGAVINILANSVWLSAARILVVGLHGTAGEKGAEQGASGKGQARGAKRPKQL
jgi:hypothetical protein